MDSEAKWTPGDWDADDGDGQYYGIFDENGAPLAYLAEDNRPLPILDDHVERAERHVANARVMAAGPKLYAALALVERGILSGRIEDQSIVPPVDPSATSLEPIALSKIIRAALSKATTGAQS